jgi:hypothetical protein
MQPIVSSRKAADTHKHAVRSTSNTATTATVEASVSSPVVSSSVSKPPARPASGTTVFRPAASASSHTDTPPSNLAQPQISTKTTATVPSSAKAVVISNDSKKSQRPLCRDFLRGFCPRKDSCTWRHEVSDEQPVCKDFQRGLCSRKPCAFLHVRLEVSAPSLCS